MEVLVAPENDESTENVFGAPVPEEEQEPAKETENTEEKEDSGEPSVEEKAPKETSEKKE